eukprot:SAG31_NODE_34816_length_329_cov_0.552174_1_plen_27_part_01
MLVILSTKSVLLVSTAVPDSAILMHRR